MYRFFYNTYKPWTTLLLLGSSSNLFFSQEGTTQGDCLSRAFYAIGICHLIEKLKDRRNVVRRLCVVLCRAKYGSNIFVLKAQNMVISFVPSTSYSVVDKCDVTYATQLLGGLWLFIT